MQMGMEWVILIGLATLGIIIVQTTYQSISPILDALDKLNEKIDALEEKLDAVQGKLEEIEDEQRAKRYVNPIEL